MVVTGKVIAAVLLQTIQVMIVMTVLVCQMVMQIWLTIGMMEI